MKRGIVFALALAGVGLFAFVVVKAGPERIWTTLKRVSLTHKQNITHKNQEKDRKSVV